MRFEYSSFGEDAGGVLPRLLLTLRSGEMSIDVVGLLDTGATVNVLPRSAGRALGALWNAQPVIPKLAGNLASTEVRALSVLVTHFQAKSIPPVHLVFAWVESDDIPVILGQTNFFSMFDVCFYRSQNSFEIHLRQ